MNKFTRYAILTLVLAFIGYGLIEARFLIEGPSIVLSSPSDTGDTMSAVVLLSGRTERTKELRADGRIIPIDTDGNFTEHITIPHGISTLTLTAIDARGRTASLTRELYRK